MKQEEASLTAQLASMQSVLSQYEELMRQNKKLQDAVDQEKKELEELRRERRRTYANMLTPEEQQFIHSLIPEPQNSTASATSWTRASARRRH